MTDFWGVWQRDPGWGVDFFGLPQIELLAESGLNLIIMNVIKQSWDANNFVSIAPTVRYRDWVKYLVDEAKARGIRTCFTYIGWREGYMGFANGSEQAYYIIHNLSGDTTDPYSREGWITCIEDMVAYCDPYAVIPYEEPCGYDIWMSNFDGQHEKWQATVDYNNFVLEIIDRLRVIQPLLQIVVMPYPYSSYGMDRWYNDTLTRYASNPYTVGGLPRPNLTYLCSGYPYYPDYDPGGAGWQTRYWNAVTQADFDAARDRLYTLLDDKWGGAITNLKMIMIPGVRAYFNLTNGDFNAGACACMIDAFNWAKNHGHDIAMFDMRGRNVHDGTYAILSEDNLGWNHLGQLLVDNNPLTPTSPECYVDTDCSPGQICYYGQCLDVTPELPRITVTFPNMRRFLSQFSLFQRIYNRIDELREWRR